MRQFFRACVVIAAATIWSMPFCGARAEADCVDQIRDRVVKKMVGDSLLIGQVGHIRVLFKKGVTRQQADEWLSSLGLEWSRSEVHDTECGKADGLDTYNVTVPSSHGVPISAMLSRSDNVLAVGTEPLLFAAADTTIVYRATAEAMAAKEHPSPNVVASVTSVGGNSGEVDRLLGQLRKLFSGRAKLDVLKREANFLKVEVHGLRGEVLAGRKLWERLELYCFLLLRNDEIELHAILDAYSATGLGSKEPDNTRFAAIGQEDDREVTQYLQRMMSNVQERLLTGK